MVDNFAPTADELVKSPMTSDGGAGWDETTLMSHSQPTNHPTATGQTYVSIRLRLEHKYIREVIKVIDDTPYCIYQHKPKTPNEHYHICIPGEIDAKHIEKFRKRFRTKFGGSGNGFVSSKGYQNGLHSFIFYCGHEGTQAIYADPLWEEVIKDQLKQDQPYYVKGQTMLDNRYGKVDEKDLQLTYCNLVSKALKHARQHQLTGGLKEVVQHLLENSRYRPSYHMVKNGVPEFYYKDYEYRSGKRQKFDMDWMTPKN